MLSQEQTTYNVGYAENWISMKCYYLSNFSHCCDIITDQNNLRNEGLTWFTFEGSVPYVREIMMAGMENPIA